MTASEDLARFIAGLTYQDLPEDVTNAAKRLLVDTLGVAIAGSTSPQGLAVQSMLRETAGPEEAVALGTRLNTSRLNAALGNGVFIRSMELEDTSEESFLHSSAGTIGASLALAEHQRCTGQELLTAIALGYEVSVRVARAVSPCHYMMGYHPAGTCGSFGAAAAASKLMGLTESQIAFALGIAGLQAAGLFQTPDPAWQYLTTVNAGRSAHLGVTAALLARHGFPGSPQIFEAPYGFCAMHSDTFDPTLITEGLGANYLMSSVGLKLYPASRTTHSSIAAAILLKDQHHIDPEAISRVVVKGFSGAIERGEKSNPQTALQAQGSQNFTVSVALTRGKFGLDDVSPEVLQEPAIQRLMPKFSIMVDPDLEEERVRHPSKWPAVVEVYMEDGTSYSQRVDSPPGSALNPATVQEIEDKYLSLATRVLPERQARDLWQMVERLEQQEDLVPFVRLWEAPLQT